MTSSSTPLRPFGQAHAVRQDARALLVGLVALLGWDASGADLPITRWYGTLQGFAWANHWLVSGVLHDGVKYAAWALFAVLVVGVWYPLPFARGLTRAQRVWWLCAIVGSLLLTNLLRRYSATSCPSQLHEFGGSVAAYVPHWHVFARDGGSGQCFPSGHASTGFAFLAGWFALRGTAPRWARLWLIATVAVGALLGWVQVMRGAHYVSHSLWTGWICWFATVVAYHAAPCWRDAPAGGMRGREADAATGAVAELATLPAPHSAI